MVKGFPFSHSIR